MVAAKAALSVPTWKLMWQALGLMAEGLGGGQPLIKCMPMP